MTVFTPLRLNPEHLIDADHLERLRAADVVFLSQEGRRYASSRARCYGFASILREHGLKAEVLSFLDHLGATDASGPVSGIPEEEKILLSLKAHAILAANPRAVLYVQKVGYHALAAALASVRGGNPIILDYDDYELDAQPFRRLEPWLPSLSPTALLETLATRAHACVAAGGRVFDIIKPLNPNTHLIHTVCDGRVFAAHDRTAPRRRFGDTVNILWCGDVWGDVVMRDVLFAIDAFALTPAAARAKARFHIIGFGRAWETFKARARERHPDMDALIFHERIAPEAFGAVLREMDIGALAYDDNEFNNGKSPTKMFEFLVAGVASCATPMGEVARCLRHEETALFGQGLEGYSRALARLILDDDLRARIAAAARVLGVERYTLEGVGPRLAAIVRGALAHAGAATTAGGFTLAEHMRITLGGNGAPRSPRETLLARRDLSAILAAPNLEDVTPRRWSSPLLALLSWPGLAWEEDLPPARAAELTAEAARLRNAARLRPRCRLPAAARPDGPPSPCKLAAAEDWDDADWYAWAERYKTNNAAFALNQNDTVSDRDRLVAEDRLDHVHNFFKRSRGVWERVHYLRTLDRLGALTRPPRALVVNIDVDGFHLALTEWAAMVAVVDIGPRQAEHAARVAAGEMDLWRAKPRRYRPDRLVIHHAPLETDPVPAAPNHDVAILPQNTLACSSDPAALLAWVDGRVRPGGLILICMEVRLNDGADVPGLPTAMIDPSSRRGGFSGMIAQHAEWEPVGDFDASLSDATLDRMVVAGAPDANNPHFVTVTGDTLHMPAVWTFRKHPNAVAPTPIETWRSCVQKWS